MGIRVMTIDTLPRDDSGRLVAYAWPGGYPVLYLDADNCVLCPECAQLSDDDDRTRPVAYSIHWEGPDEQCENCGEMIPSAYGNPDEE